jgi:hypothetical protein
MLPVPCLSLGPFARGSNAVNVNCGSARFSKGELAMMTESVTHLSNKSVMMKTRIYTSLRTRVFYSLARNTTTRDVKYNWRTKRDRALVSLIAR